MADLLERLGVERPVVQAGMGGGLSTSPLAAAVSAAGGLGTIGILPPNVLRAELNAARELTDGPVAINLLLPFARRGHFEVAADADALVTFWGRPRRRAPGIWIHQCGSVEEVLDARAAGADAVIAQGVEAGGHVRGTTPAADLLGRVREAVGSDYPVWSAGGVATADDVTARLESGADAVVSGTRFLLSEESGAHPDYKERLLGADATLLTELFGAGWPAAHRVISNEATARWTRGDRRGPGWLRAFNAVSAPLLSRLPMSAQARFAAMQSPNRPVLGPVAPTVDGPESLLDAGPLYAGESVARIRDLRPAAELVRELAP